MRNFLIGLVAFVLVVGLAVAHAQTIEGVPVIREGEYPTGNKLIRIFDSKINKAQAVYTKYSTDVVATDPITLPGNTSFVRIDATTVTSTPTISISSTGAVEGQVLYVFNGNASATDGIATISSNKMAQFFFASGAWRLIADE